MSLVIGEILGQVGGAQPTEKSPVPPLARDGAMTGALASGSGTAQLHHPLGQDRQDRPFRAGALLYAKAQWPYPTIGFGIAGAGVVS